MDTGHYNCRDYYISPQWATPTNKRSPLLFRHESFDQLEERSRSPKSQQPKFPLLSLPLELRQYIYGLLLPRTKDRHPPSPLTTHARNFSAVKKRVERGLFLGNGTRGNDNHIIWKRGNIHLLSVCKQVHDECAELLYGTNTFLLFVTYSGTTFRFNWRLPTGMTPSKHYNFLEVMPKKYLALLKRVIINVDHTDDYTGMIKFNVQGKGLTHGLCKQIQRLINALQPQRSIDEDEDDLDHQVPEDRRLASVKIGVSHGNMFLETIRPNEPGPRKKAADVRRDIEDMLHPFESLRGVREVNITGPVTQPLMESLRAKMMSTELPAPTMSLASRLSEIDLLKDPPICVYGNDL